MVVYSGVSECIINEAVLSVDGELTGVASFFGVLKPESSMLGLTRSLRIVFFFFLNSSLSLKCIYFLPDPPDDGPFLVSAQ